MVSKAQRITVENVARVVDGAGGWLSRRDIAGHMNRAKTTHLIATVERAAAAGLIVKVSGDIDGRTGYLYGSHDTYQTYLNNRQ